MKKAITALFIIIGISSITAQDKISVTTKIGSGASMSTPSATPLTLEALGHYNLNRHWAFGVGTGYSLYNQTSLIPIYANVKYTINPEAKHTLFADWSLGHAFAFGSDKNGGFYMNPEFGVERKICNKTVSIAVGYQIQEFEQLKKNSDEYVSTQFVEALSHHSISIKLGVTF